jgi:hypothetical protein
MPAANLRTFEATLTEVGIRSLRLEAGASVSKLKWLQGQLGVLLPPSLQTLLAWHNGEGEGARLFNTLLAHEFEPTWRAVYPDLALDVTFLSVSKIAIAGAIGVSMGPAEILGAAENASASFHVIPFLCVQSLEAPHEKWYLGVDTRDERVWLCARDASHAPSFHLRAESLKAWFEQISQQLLAPGPSPERERLLRELLPTPRQVPGAKRTPSDARSLLNMLVAEQAIELESGVEDALELRVLKQLVKRPRAEAVRGIVALLSEDAGIAEIYASDDALRRMINGFVS